MKPRIHNRYWLRRRLGFDRVPPMRMPWVLTYGEGDTEQELAIAGSQQEAVEELARLQWAGKLPTPGEY